MKKLYIYLLLVSLTTILTSCVEVIEPAYKFEEQVFISGLMTSEASLISLQIQNTVEANDSIFNPVNNAQVSLYTKDSSNSVSLVSNSFTINNGDYTSTEEIIPIIGNTYWIEVVLDDTTILQSEEEVMKAPVSILGMQKIDDVVKITFEDQTDSQNFYLFQIDVFEDDELIEEYTLLINDTNVTENLEESISLENVNDGNTVKVDIYNLNFNTFQFYYNVFSVEDDLSLSSLFLPSNIVGNITNITTDELALGNFGITGYSTMVVEF